jgi:hypothetical protein
MSSVRGQSWRAQNPRGAGAGVAADLRVALVASDRVSGPGGERQGALLARKGLPGTRARPGVLESVANV